MSQKQHIRLHWLDALKGFAILTVIYIHCYNGYSIEATINEKIIKGITAFHMQIFFACAGYCFHFNCTDISEKIKKKFVSLMIPYLFWGVFAGFLLENGRLIIKHSTSDLLTYIILLATGRKAYLACWFLMVLMGVYLLEYFLAYSSTKLFDKTGFGKSYIVIMHLVFFILGYLIKDLLIGDFFKLGLALISTSFFGMGYLWNKFRYKNALLNGYWYKCPVLIGGGR